MFSARHRWIPFIRARRRSAGDCATKAQRASFIVLPVRHRIVPDVGGRRRIFRTGPAGLRPHVHGGPTWSSPRSPGPQQLSSPLPCCSSASPRHEATHITRHRPPISSGGGGKRRDWPARCRLARSLAGLILPVICQQERDDPAGRRGEMTPVIIEDDARAGRTQPAPAIPDLTVAEFVLAAAYRHRSKRAVVHAATGHELSYAGLADAVREAGAGLLAQGIRPGDVLALCAPNCLEFAVAWFAAMSIGAIVTPVNPQSTGNEITRQLRQTGARWWSRPRCSNRSCARSFPGPRSCRRSR